MPISARRIAAISLIASLGISAWLALRQPHQPTPDTAAAWLELPAESMDARRQPVREAILSAMVAEQNVMPPDPLRSLAMTCGMGLPDEPAERYVAVIGDWVLKPDARTWRVQIVPTGTTMRVTITDYSILPPPPPPPLPGGARTRRTDIATPAIHDMPRADMERIRQAWSAPALWKTPDQPIGCVDGRAALFEACVRGHYTVSRRGCSLAGREVEALWQAFRQQLPEPPRKS